MTKGKRNGRLNALTIDVEDWFHVTAFDRSIRLDEWERCEVRVGHNVRRILDMLSEEKIDATFFVLGWIAERFPEIVKSIHDAGHEVATHGYDHRMVSQLAPREFASDVTKSIEVIEQITRTPVLGYRAPSYSIVEETSWAWEILVDLGLRYSSSVFPINHDRYGIPWAPRHPFVLRTNGTGRLVEFPLSTVSVMGRNLPVAGGAYLRLYPYWFIRWGLSRINGEGMPAVVYFHPWEIDPGQPRQPVGLVSQLRHYTNLGRMEQKIRTLLRDFQFASVGRVLSTNGFGLHGLGIETSEEAESPGAKHSAEDMKVETP
jgi:polysaccharide deacetylase family protein (PEP-CTERM system associated)